jgi:hypothetical protein
VPPVEDSEGLGGDACSEQRLAVRAVLFAFHAVSHADSAQFVTGLRSLTLGALDRTMHFLVKPFDVLFTEAADAGRELHRADQPCLFPAAERVLVDSEPPCGLADS